MAPVAVSAGEMGAPHVIGVVPAVFLRWLRRLELAAVPVGRRFEIDGTRSQAALFKLAQIMHRRVSREIRITGSRDMGRHVLAL